MSVGGACGVIVGYFIEVVDSQIQRATLAAKGNVFKEQEIKDDISANRLLRQRSALWWNLAHLIVTIIIGMVLFNAFGTPIPDGWADLFYAAVLIGPARSYTFETAGGRVLGCFYMMIGLPMLAKWVASVPSCEFATAFLPLPFAKIFHGSDKSCCDCRHH